MTWPYNAFLPTMVVNDMEEIIHFPLHVPRPQNMPYSCANIENCGHLTHLINADLITAIDLYVPGRVEKTERER